MEEMARAEVNSEKATRGQVTKSAADVYDAFFVPALFRQWTGRVSDAAGLKEGDRVLDVACGTGTLAREALACVLPGGSVAGVDINNDMLAVARRKLPGIDWHQAPAESLPFEDGAFDAVVSQFGLMFFEDRLKALVEMWRVLRPDGRLAVAVWDSLDKTPGYAAVTALLRRRFGDGVARAMRAPFDLGDSKTFLSLFAAAGILRARCSTCDGTARFPSIESWVHTDIKGWTLADTIDEDQFLELQREAQIALRRFAQPDGSVRFATPAHIVTARKI
jgi:ubiquinone/menaquinone biosynthesis C-methylase UbiE